MADSSEWEEHWLQAEGMPGVFVRYFWMEDSTPLLALFLHPELKLLEEDIDPGPPGAGVGQMKEMGHSW